MPLTDQDILSDVQSLLAEPIDGGVSWPSGMWTPIEAANAIDHVQNDLMMTGIVLKRVTGIVCIPHVLRHDLPDDVIQLVRVVWVRALDGRRFPLDPTDIWELDAVLYSGTTNWRQEAGIPKFYTTSDVPAGVIQLAPAPSLVGSLEITYVPAPVTVDGSGIPLSVPDDFSVMLTWGTIMHLLTKEGRAKDPARAALADQRVQLATEATKLILKGWVQ